MLTAALFNPHNEDYQLKWPSIHPPSDYDFNLIRGFSPHCHNVPTYLSSISQARYNIDEMNVTHTRSISRRLEGIGATDNLKVAELSLFRVTN